MSEATSAVDEAIPEAPPEDTQLAFDVHAFPGGVRGALEAVLMVVDEPLSAVALASALEVPVPDVEAELETLLSPGQRHKRASEDPDDER